MYFMDAYYTYFSYLVYCDTKIDEIWQFFLSPESGVLIPFLSRKELCRLSAVCWYNHQSLRPLNLMMANAYSQEEHLLQTQMKEALSEIQCMAFVDLVYSCFPLPSCFDAETVPLSLHSIFDTLMNVALGTQFSWWVKEVNWKYLDEDEDVNDSEVELLILMTSEEKGPTYQIQWQIGTNSVSIQAVTEERKTVSLQAVLDQVMQHQGKPPFFPMPVICSDSERDQACRLLGLAEDEDLPSIFLRRDDMGPFQWFNDDTLFPGPGYRSIRCVVCHKEKEYLSDLVNMIQCSEPICQLCNIMLSSFIR